MGDGLKYLNELGVSLWLRLIYEQSGPAFTFIYIAQSTSTPRKFSVLICASGLWFFFPPTLFYAHWKTRPHRKPALEGSSVSHPPSSECKFLEGTERTHL